MWSLLSSCLCISQCGKGEDVDTFLAQRTRDWMANGCTCIFVCGMFSFSSSFPPKLKVRMKEALHGLLPPCISGSKGFSAPHLNIHPKESGADVQIWRVTSHHTVIHGFWFLYLCLLPLWGPQHLQGQKVNRTRDMHMLLSDWTKRGHRPLLVMLHSWKLVSQSYIDARHLWRTAPG